MRSRNRCADFARTSIALAILGLSVFAEARSVPDLNAEPRTASATFDLLVAARGADAGADAEHALTALGAFSRAELHTVIERAAEPGTGEDAAVAALAVLERFGRADDLVFAGALHRPSADVALEQAVLGVARRDGRALAVLEGASRAVTPAVRIAFVRAVEQLETLDAASWIARCAQRAPDVRAEAIARLGRLSEGLPHPAPDEALDLVHSVLGGIPTDGLRDAVIAAGRMEDGEAIPYLIALLGEDDSGLRSDAAWSLQRITGLRLRERKERWEQWYAGELAWWRDRSEYVFSDLDSLDRATLTKALLEISARQSSRDQLALRVMPLLQSPAPDVAKLAAQTLRILRSKVACVELIRALERPEPEIGLEAWRALRAITRKDIPRDVDAWRSACRA